EVRHAEEVLADQRVLALVAHGEKVGEEAAAGVVHEDVDRAEVSGHSRHEVCTGRLVPNVELAGHDPPARGLDAVGGGIEVGDVPVADRDVGAESGKGQGHRLADPDGGAGDDSDPVGEQGGRRVEGHDGGQYPS